jgi:hypothetical protein
MAALLFMTVSFDRSSPTYTCPDSRPDKHVALVRPCFASYRQATKPPRLTS